VAGRLREQARTVNHRAALGIVGGEVQLRDPRQRDRPGAHRARLQRNPQFAPVEPRTIERPGRAADRDHLGMGGRVVAAAHRVGSFGDHHPVAGNHRADRHFARRCRLMSEIERAAHR